MKDGKELCEFLKSIRKRIADANGISYEPHECHHEGYCPGTCPMCDSELVKLLEEIYRLNHSGTKVNYDVLTEEEKDYLSGYFGIETHDHEEYYQTAGIPAPIDDRLMGDPVGVRPSVSEARNRIRNAVMPSMFWQKIMLDLLEMHPEISDTIIDKLPE